MPAVLAHRACDNEASKAESQVEATIKYPGITTVHAATTPRLHSLLIMKDRAHGPGHVRLCTCVVDEKTHEKESFNPPCFPDVSAVEKLQKKSRKILFNGRSRAPILPYPAPDSHIGTSRQSGDASLDAALFHNAHFSEAERRSMQETVTVPRKTPCYRRRWLGYCHHPTALCPG